MNKLALALSTVATVALFALAGCSKGSELVKAQEDFANKTCACADIACLKKVSEEQAAWAAKNGSAAAGSEDDGEKLGAAAKKMTECFTRISAAGK